MAAHSIAARTWALLVWPLLLAPAPASPACPAGFAADATRAHAIEARLRGDGEARAMLTGAAAFALCFGPTNEPGVTPDGAVLLPRALPEAQAAARVAHLVHHRLPGSPLAAPHGDCARWVERALDEEADAYALELRLLRAAGATSSLPFTDAQPSAIRRWLGEHREGGGGVPALAIDYAARCTPNGLSSNDFDRARRVDAPRAP